MMQKILLVPVLIVGLASTASACEERIYKYSTYAPNDLRQFSYGMKIDINKKELWIGHSGQQVRICGEDSALYCIHSLALNFAIPKANPAGSRSWSSGGIEFRLEGTEILNVLGESTRVLVISSEEGVREHRYFYSEVRGLLGIVTIDKSRDNPYKTVFLLEQKVGFPL